MNFTRQFLVSATLIISTCTCWAQGTVPREEAPAALKAEESQKRFKLAEGLAMSLVAAEPQVSQPLSISFDDRGRMWVLQYLQFPNPNGLKPVKVDNWLRTEYDKVPEPPPKGPKGKDRISIYEDTNGDGRADKVTHFLDDLNLASGMALGHGGVFVVQPPYLLFYADRNRDDVPDGDPEVLLKGFGMNDAHAFANSLTWGPDGWLYGAQGSTATADILGIGFQQGVWRYHPLTKQFELFAEGGGNTWGIDFDQFGNLFAGGNTVEPLVHHVQGAYYVKGFGKHGPLHNPHTYGYFLPVKHYGYTGDSLTGGFVLYQGGAFPQRFDGNCIAPNTRHSASRWSTLEKRGSTFATRAAGDFITTDDIWFRPVDSTVGPDGALYVADWYDYSISHSSPKNRSKWYQPSRFDGRVWRVAPPETKRIEHDAFDLSKQTNQQLIKFLSHPNDWYARKARRIFAERRDLSIVLALRKLLDSDDQRLALQALWSIYVSGGFTNAIAESTLRSKHEYVRAWTVRLLGDANFVTRNIQAAFVEAARSDPSVIVRSQLACTAKRLPGDLAIPIVAELIRHDEDVNDVHIPLLIWWAIEDKAMAEPNAVLPLVQSTETWKLPMMRQILLERLARRFAAEDSKTGYRACARLLGMASKMSDQQILLTGIARALQGRVLVDEPVPLQVILMKLLRERAADPTLIQILLRMKTGGVAEKAAFRLLDDRKRNSSDRVTIIQTLGETRTDGGIDKLLQLLEQKRSPAEQSAAISALGYFEDEQIGRRLLELLPKLQTQTQSRAIELLCSRESWARHLLNAVDQKRIESSRIPIVQLRSLSKSSDEKVKQLIAKHWGKVRPATALERQGRITAISQMLSRRKGDVENGVVLFKKTCANCHKLHGDGTKLGPDLTGAERKDRLKLLKNIVDPSAVIRPQFVSHQAVTSSGRVLTGLLADSNAETVTLLDAKNKRTILNRDELAELNESTVSLMPDDLLKSMTDQQIRDLFAYLQSDGKAKVSTGR